MQKSKPKATGMTDGLTIIMTEREEKWTGTSRKTAFSVMLQVMDIPE